MPRPHLPPHGQLLQNRLFRLQSKRLSLRLSQRLSLRLSQRLSLRVSLQPRLTHQKP
jgi:hypothetical protein